MRGITLSATLMIFLLVVGTVGYTALEHWSVFDAFYMTVITLATVGFGETHPLTTGGRIFTIALILGGVLTVSYFGTQLVSTLVSGDLRRMLDRRSMDKALAQLSQHVIVCGYGRMGRRVAQELGHMKVPFVIIERSNDAAEAFDIPGGLILHGDATSDDILRRAGVERARALITVVADDGDNLLITMSARLLSEKLFIVPRVEDERNEGKMARAGASRVVSPYALTGYRVAQSVVRPTVIDFIEVAIGTQHLDLQLDEVKVEAGASLAGRAFTSEQMREQYGSMLVAIKRASGKMVYVPAGDERIEAGDVLVVLGPPSRLESLEAAARASGRRA